MASPKRGENESFENFKKRRLILNKIDRIILRGRWIWNSKAQGTYRRADG